MTADRGISSYEPKCSLGTPRPLVIHRSVMELQYRFPDWMPHPNQRLQKRATLIAVAQP